MRVLVTNDDGVEAPGLVALATAVAHAGHEVVVVAPSGERSGSGAAIGRLHRAGPVACTEVEWAELPGVSVFALDLPPAAAVYAGVVGAFGARPDAVASGVNPGLNYGHLVLHSGTVGAALTAAALGVPGVAVSIAWRDHPHWGTAAGLVPAALEWATAHPVPCAVSINVPDVAPGELKGVRDAVPAPFMEQWTAEHRPGEVVLDFQRRRDDPPPGTDLAYVLDGYAAVTTFAGITPMAERGAAAAIAATSVEGTGDGWASDYAARS